MITHEGRREQEPSRTGLRDASLLLDPNRDNLWGVQPGREQAGSAWCILDEGNA